MCSRYHGRDGLLPAGDSRFLTLGSIAGGGGGGALCLIGVNPDGTLVQCGNSAPRMDINLFDHSSGLMDCLDLLCDTGESGVSSIRHSPGLSNTGLLKVTGVRFDVFDIGLFSEADSVRFGAALVVSDVTGDGDHIPMATAARSRGDGSRCCVLAEVSKTGGWCESRLCALSRNQL